MTKQSVKFDDVDHSAIKPEDLLKLLPQKHMGYFYDLKQIVHAMIEKTKLPYHTFTAPKAITEELGAAGAQAIRVSFTRMKMDNWSCSYNKERRVWLVWDKDKLEAFKKGGNK